MKRTLLLTALFSLLIVCSALAMKDLPPPPSAQTKCPVCGMFVARYPDWVASLTFRDTTIIYFDGPKDLFTYCRYPAKYDPARKRSDIAAMYVKDYYSLLPIDGRRALYVIGSNVSGPMGNELAAFEKRADAEGFLEDHQGKKILRFEEITPALLKSLE